LEFLAHLDNQELLNWLALPVTFYLFQLEKESDWQVNVVGTTLSIMMADNNFHFQMSCKIFLLHGTK